MRAQTDALESFKKKKKTLMPIPGPLIFTALAARHPPCVYMEEYSSVQFSSFAPSTAVAVTTSATAVNTAVARIMPEQNPPKVLKAR